MSDLVKIFIVIMTFGVLPAIVGYGTSKCLKQSSNIWKDIVYGNIVIWAMFQIVCFCCIIFNATLTCLVSIMVSVVLLMSIAVCIMCREMFGVYCKRIEAFIFDKNVLKWVSVVIVIAWVIWEIVMQHTDADDYEFVAYATAARQSNRLLRTDPNTGGVLSVLQMKRVVAPFPMLIAAYSVIINVHPAVMSHSVMPAILVALAYMVYYNLGLKIFQVDEENKHKKDMCYIFLLFITIMLAFGGYSTRTMGSMLILRSWQGKAVLASIMLPCVFEILMNIMRRGITRELWFSLAITIMAGTLTSAMAEILLPSLVGCFAIVYTIKKKSVVDGGKLLLACFPCFFFIVVYLLG